MIVRVQAFGVIGNLSRTRVIVREIGRLSQRETSPSCDFPPARRKRLSHPANAPRFSRSSQAFFLSLGNGARRNAVSHFSKAACQICVSSSPGSGETDGVNRSSNFPI